MYFVPVQFRHPLEAEYSAEYVEGEQSDLSLFILDYYFLFVGLGPDD